ncbi:MAG: chemotaxis protein CheX [Sulfurimonas sp.]|nr:chemotaxis protein CheX [Sulfurimonas sp.]PHQ88686.1 MAG: chemotaxis protein CheX [Sulfurimonas sp.]PHQ92424.1 MAG: chemotaxis protein CheX [Sulfurimonas sp.]
MLKTIIEASENFCIHQIRITPIVHDRITKIRTLIAYIDLDTHDSRKYRVYVASSIAFMQRVSKLFLEEDESDEETLIDMTLETANLIIGSAKVMAQETNENPYTIGTPYFEKYDTFDFDFDEAKLIRVCNDDLIIAIKELT